MNFYVSFEMLRMLKAFVTEISLDFRVALVNKMIVFFVLVIKRVKADLAWIRLNFDGFLF